MICLQLIESSLQNEPECFIGFASLLNGFRDIPQKACPSGVQTKVQIALFTVSFFLFPLQCNLTWMRGNFGLNLQNSPKLPHIHARLYCNANEKN